MRITVTIVAMMVASVTSTAARDTPIEAATERPPEAVRLLQNNSTRINNIHTAGADSETF